MQRRQVVVRDTRRTTLNMYAGWQRRRALLIRRVWSHMAKVSLAIRTRKINY